MEAYSNKEPGFPGADNDTDFTVFLAERPHQTPVLDIHKDKRKPSSSMFNALLMSTLLDQIQVPFQCFAAKSSNLPITGPRCQSSCRQIASLAPFPYC